MDEIDHRTATNGELTVTIPTREVVSRTFPPFEYPVSSDFCVSITFSNYSHQGANSNPGSWINSSAGISINWVSDQLDPIGGEPLLGNLSMWRGSWSSDDSQHYLCIHGLNNANYGTVVSLQELATTDTFGTLKISKLGGVITATAVDSFGQTNAWSYAVSELNIAGDSLEIGIDTSNGPYDSTSAHYSRFEMAPLFGPTVGIASESNSVAVAFEARKGAAYRLQHITSLVDTNWADIGSPIAGDGSLVVIPDLIQGVTTRFYRVLVEY